MLREMDAPARVRADVRDPERVNAPDSRRRVSNLLAERITRAASKQAYYTARFLVDRDRTPDAYRAYAYFRWVDDQLDQGEAERAQRLAFVARQRALVERLYRGERPEGLSAEERLLAELVQRDDEVNSGLQSYIRNMMAVMEFDAYRRGRLITGRQLTAYAGCLSTAVTDALHYFIGHADPLPDSDARYLPAMAAHISHMLRDTFEDIAAGYYNVPCEALQSNLITPGDISSPPYREWVRGRVQLARAYFRAGAEYLDQVRSLRCRLAGYAYMARFTGILDAIENDGYLLRPSYPGASRLSYSLRMAGSAGLHALLRGAL